MKRLVGIIVGILAVLSSVIALADVEINEENFPDEMFREYVRQFDKNMDGVISDDELHEVNIISIEGARSLEGIQYFTELTILQCKGKLGQGYYIGLESLDVSQNAKLIRIDCHGNQLSSLDVTKNTEIQFLDCSENQITSLDFSNCNRIMDIICFNPSLPLLVMKKRAVIGSFCLGFNWKQGSIKTRTF